MQKIWHTLLRLIFPPLLYTTIQFITMYLVYHGCALYLGGGPQALAQSAQLLLAYSLPILILSACLTIPLLLWLFSRDVRRRPLAPRACQRPGRHLVLDSRFWPGALLEHQYPPGALPTGPICRRLPRGLHRSLRRSPVAAAHRTCAHHPPLRRTHLPRAHVPRTSGRAPLLAAALLSSLAFAIYHGNLYQGAYAFCVGLCLAWIYERTHVFLAPVILHISANLFSVLFSYPAVNTWLDTHITLFGLMIPVLFVLTIFSLVLIRRRTAET